MNDKAYQLYYLLGALSAHVRMTKNEELESIYKQMKDILDDSIISEYLHKGAEKSAQLADAMSYFHTADKYGFSSDIDDMTDDEIIQHYKLCLQHEDLHEDDEYIWEK